MKINQGTSLIALQALTASLKKQEPVFHKITSQKVITVQQLDDLILI